jgi:hypothetical protein
LIGAKKEATAIPAPTSSLLIIPPCVIFDKDAPICCNVYIK